MKIANYKNLTIGKKEVVLATPEELEVELNKLLASKTQYVEKNGKSELGDTVNLNYKGLLDDVAFPGGTADEYDLVLGSHSFIPGFEEQLVGYEKGADVDVNVTFPTEYHAPDLAGKAVVFKCHINEVKEKKDPELNDEFAQSYGLANLDMLKEELMNQMNAKKKNDIENEYLGILMQGIIADSEVEVPEELMKSRTDEMYDYYENQVAQYGMDLPSFLQMQGQTIETFRDQLAKEAMISAQGDVIFAEIAKLENLTVSDSEVTDEMELYKKYYNIPDAEFETFVKERKNDVANDLLRRKVALFLLDNNN